MNTAGKPLSSRGLRLRRIPPVLRQRALAAAAQGDVTFFRFADSNQSLAIFLENHRWFERYGLYEKALLAAWVNQKWVPPDGDALMRDALLRADRQRLLDASDALPEGETFVLYRGVQQGRPRGVSWTFSDEVARIFAHLPYEQEPGTVYTTTVSRAAIYAHIHESGREEAECLLVLPPDYPITSVANQVP